MSICRNNILVYVAVISLGVITTDHYTQRRRLASISLSYVLIVIYILLIGTRLCHIPQFSSGLLKIISYCKMTMFTHWLVVLLGQN
jgi:hypothetical protein